MSMTNEQFIAIAEHNYPNRFRYHETQFAGADKTVLVQNKMTGDYHNILAADLIKEEDKSWVSDLYMDAGY